MKNFSHNGYRRAFTLVELLVVIAIIGILIAMLLPAVQSVREAGRRTTCINNQRQISLAVTNHENALMFFPDGGGNWNLARTWSSTGIPAVAPKQSWGWMYQILAYMEQDNVHKLSSDATVRATFIPSYACPSRRAASKFTTVNGSSIKAFNDYAGNGGVNSSTSPNFGEGRDGAIFVYYNNVVPRVANKDITDGLSLTLLTGEKVVHPDHYDGSSINSDDQGWTAGFDWDTIRWGIFVPVPDANVNQTTGDRRYGSAHSSGVVFSYADGHLKLMSYGVDLTVFQNLSRRNDGKSVTIPD